MRRISLIVVVFLTLATVRSWSAGDAFATVGALAVVLALVGVITGAFAPWIGADMALFWFRARHGLLLRRALDLGVMLRMTGFEFEAFSAEVLRRQGYRARVTPPYRDLGVDIEIRGREGFGLVQCKRFAPDKGVGRPVLQQLYGQMQSAGADFGCVITTSYFSRDADDWALDKPIKLIDGTLLETLAASARDRPSWLERIAPGRSQWAALVATGLLLLYGAGVSLVRLFGLTR